jgi:hypothetical protein
MNIDDIEEMRRIMLSEDNPLVDDVVEEVIEALDEIKASMEDKAPIVEPVDAIKEALMKNAENHLGSISTHDGSNSRMGVNEAIRTLTSRMIDKMAVRHFVGVQPMSGPVGILYALEYEFNDNEKMSLNINSHSVEAGSRKLAYSLTLEAQQDLAAQHPNADDIDPATDMAKEIYEEIRNDISTIAHKETIDVAAIMDDVEFITHTTVQTIEILINRSANMIAQRTRRGAGNFIIVSETLAEILKNSTNFVTTSETDKDYGYVKYLGTLHGAIKVYCDFDLAQDKSIVGYKGGNGETDTGYIYAPYVPLMSTGVVVNPSTFQPIIKFMTRYGKKALQKTTETISDAGLTTTTNRELSGYYVELTFDNLPEMDKLKFKKEEKKETKDVGIVDDALDLAVDAFDAAMNLID